MTGERFILSPATWHLVPDRICSVIVTLVFCAAVSCILLSTGASSVATCCERPDALIRSRLTMTCGTVRGHSVPESRPDPQSGIISRRRWNINKLACLGLEAA